MSVGFERDALDSFSALYEGSEMVRNSFERGLFWIPPIEGTWRPSVLALHLKIFTLKQMLQRLPIAHAKVNAGNTCEKLLKKCITI